jgi:C-1 hydroxylase
MVVACGGSKESASEANKQIVRLYIEAYNDNDLARFDEMLATDFVRHSGSRVEARSLEEFKERVRSGTEAFPDRRIQITALVAEADRVVVYGEWSGTQEAPYGSLPASGKKAVVLFFYMFRIEGGKIAEMWTEWDNVNFLQQLGHYSEGRSDV